MKKIILILITSILTLNANNLNMKITYIGKDNHKYTKIIVNNYKVISYELNRIYNEAKKVKFVKITNQ